MKKILLILTLVAGPAPVLADEAGEAQVEQIMKRSFTTATPEEWAERLSQDEAMQWCSRYRNSPPAEVAQKIAASQFAAMRYPTDGKLMGNWKEGEKLASIGSGGHIGTIQPDRPDTRRGGNCYACHVLDAKEVAAGNLGPSLNRFGKLRGVSPEMVKYTYEKIYNAQAYFPCSPMPRFGHNKWLTPEQVAHTVAYLLDPQSPVNQ
ncbi:MAG: sulfur oxidation c-type cytochrome SoxX [Burkholderiales bacterium]